MKISGIYKIQSVIKPERIYIGSAVDVKQRWAVHLHTLRNNKHHSIKLQRHFNKYAESDLIFIIIEPCFPEFLIIREQYYLDNNITYFNNSKIAGSPLGVKHSKEFCIKNSERNKESFLRKLVRKLVKQKRGSGYQKNINKNYLKLEGVKNYLKRRAEKYQNLIKG
jgi:group I intron endonuclease